MKPLYLIVNNSFSRKENLSVKLIRLTSQLRQIQSCFHDEINHVIINEYEQLLTKINE